MHKNIKRFGMEGEVGDDADFARLRTQYEFLIVQQMHDAGYVPVLGLGPFWSTTYNEEKGVYEFVLSVHGIYVGKKRVWDIVGITLEGRTVTPPPKSKQS